MFNPRTKLNIDVTYELILWPPEHNRDYKVVKEAHWGAEIFVGRRGVWEIHSADEARRFGWHQVAFDIEKKELLSDS